MIAREANKIIAEFMGRKFVSMTPECEYMCVIKSDEPNYEKAYSTSLDALVPVWEKIHEQTLWNFEICSDTTEAFQIIWHHFGINKVDYESPLNMSIQEAAAIATAKAINETLKEIE